MTGSASNGVDAGVGDVDGGGGGVDGDDGLLVAPLNRSSLTLLLLSLSHLLLIHSLLII